MKDNYTYAALISEEDGTNIVEFPAFNNFVIDIPNEDDLITSAQDALASRIIDMEKYGERIPEDVRVIPKNNEKVIYINVWLPYHRAKIVETYTKKTLTIPTYIDLLAKANGINFSAVLVKALKDELGIN